MVIGARKRPFKKRTGFNTSYYSKKKQGNENVKHFEVKGWLEVLLNQYSFITTKEYSHDLLMPEYKTLSSDSKPYHLDLLGYHEYRGEIITIEVNGKYHYKKRQLIKDENRRIIVKDFIKNHFVKTILWLSQMWKKIDPRYQIEEKHKIDGENKLSTNQYFISNPYDPYLRLITHKHFAISKVDVLKKLWDYDSLVEFMRL